MTRLKRLLAFIEHDAGNLELRKDAIREAFDAGDWSVARDLLDLGLLAFPDEPELHYYLAFARFMQRRYVDALALLTAELAQTLPIALVLRARCQHYLGRPDDAIADCKTHLSLVPEHAETHGLLALLLHEQGQNAQATEHAETALRHDATQPEAFLTIASMQSDARDYDAARRSFDVLLQAHPDCGRGWLGLALIELAQMRVEPAARSIELAAKHLPDHIGTWHVVAWLAILRDDLAAAATAFEQALVLNRNFAETHGGLAVVAVLQGREDDARDDIKRALRLDQQSMAVVYAQMLLLKRHGRHNEAQLLLDKFLERPVERTDMQYRDLLLFSLNRAGTNSVTCH